MNIVVGINNTTHNNTKTFNTQNNSHSHSRENSMGRSGY